MGAMVAPGDVIAEARRFDGQPYVFGAEGDTKPDQWIGPVDCSELVQIACKRAGVRPAVPDGAYYQWRHCRGISIAEAKSTPGALLFVGDGTGVGRNAITHVAISLGNAGRTFEARSRRWPVGEFGNRSGWTFAGLIPGVDYTAGPHALTDDGRMDLATRIAAARSLVDDSYELVAGRSIEFEGKRHWYLAVSTAAERDHQSKDVDSTAVMAVIRRLESLLAQEQGGQ